MARGSYTKEQRTVAARLKSARLEAGLTQAEVSEALGCRQAFISKLESGQARIDAILLSKMAKLYRKPVAWFLT